MSENEYRNTRGFLGIGLASKGAGHGGDDRDASGSRR